MKKYKESEKLFTLLFSPKIFIKIISKPITLSHLLTFPIIIIIIIIITTYDSYYYSLIEKYMM